MTEYNVSTGVVLTSLILKALLLLKALGRMNVFKSKKEPTSIVF